MDRPGAQQESLHHYIVDERALVIGRLWWIKPVEPRQADAVGRGHPSRFFQRVREDQQGIEMAHGLLMQSAPHGVMHGRTPEMVPGGWNLLRPGRR